MPKCPICDYEYIKPASFSHHLGRANDINHINYLLQQKKIAEKLFLEEIATEELLKKHKEFELSRKFLTRFWKELFTNEEIKLRGNRVISNHHQTFEISKDELEDLYINQSLTDEQIAKKYNTRAANIHYSRAKNKITTLKQWERHKRQDLSSIEKSIILGAMLGDGYMHKGKNSANACFATNHSIIQKEYLEWLFKSLKDWIPAEEPKYAKSKPHPKTGKCYERFSFETISHPIFDNISDVFYREKVKIIDKQYLLENLDALALAVWVMDDGSCDKDSGSIRIYTNSFMMEEVLDLIDILLKKFNIKAKVITIKNRENNKIYPIIKFNKKGAFELVKIIRKHIIPSMQYKILPVLLKNNVNLNIKNEIIRDGEIDIGREQWLALNDNNDKSEIKSMIIDAVKRHGVVFPCKSLSLDDAKKDFCKLKLANDLMRSGEFETKFNYKYDLSKQYIEQNNVGSISSDFFQQINRMNCSNIRGHSPVEVWNNENLLSSTLNYLWSMKREMVDGDVLRGAMRLRGYTASQFKPSVAKYIYDTYGNKGRVLDFSAGWGDRLAGFCASDCKSYTGIDPNKSVFDKYKEQADLYNTGKETIFINSPAEDVDLGSARFDLIFSSPPYFNQERYTNDENQSWVRYQTLDTWLNGFLFKTISNFWDNLEVGGHLIVNMSDVNSRGKRQVICDPMNDYISQLMGAVYQGAIGMRMSKRPNSKAIKGSILAEPLWIWKKVQIL